MDISADFPFESRFIEVKGSKMHYIEQGDGPVFLFLHGNPTSSYLWRNIIPEVSKYGRCIAPDLIGFGRSDRPDIGYTFSEHYEYIKGFIDTMGLKDIVLVTHDWGGAIGFHYAINHQDNVKGNAFMETFAFTFTWTDFPGDFRMGFKMFRLPVVGKLMIMVLNIFVRKILPSAVHRGLRKDIHDRYKEPFSSIRSRYPVYVWPNEIPIEGRENRTFRIIKDLEGRFSELAFPMLLFIASPGGIMTKKNVQWFRDNTQDLTIKDIGPGIHYLQEDNPSAIASGIVEWAKDKGLV